MARTRSCTPLRSILLRAASTATGSKSMASTSDPPSRAAANAQYGRAAADVNAGVPLLQIFLQKDEAHACRLVDACAKGHARVHLDDPLPLPGLIGLPAGPDHQAPADMCGLIVLLPLVGPVLFRTWLTEMAHPPGRIPHIRHCPLHGEDILPQGGNGIPAGAHPPQSIR